MATYPAALPRSGLDADARPVRFTRFAIRKTGLIPTQVQVRIDEHLLVCAPFQLSRRRAVFVAALSAEEARFFERFQGRTCRVNLHFRSAGRLPERSLFLRGTLDRIEALKEKPGACLIDIAIKVCPHDLVDTLAGYLRTVDSLERLFQYFAGRAIELNSTNARLTGYDGQAEVRDGPAWRTATLTSLAVDRLAFVVPGKGEGFALGSRCVVRPRPHGGAFDVDARVVSRQPAPEGGLQLVVAAEFTPDLVEAVDGYFFRMPA
jgi:hypothetical protein